MQEIFFLSMMIEMVGQNISTDSLLLNFISKFLLPGTTHTFLTFIIVSKAYTFFKEQKCMP